MAQKTTHLFKYFSRNNNKLGGKDNHMQLTNIARAIFSLFLLFSFISSVNALETPKSSEVINADETKGLVDTHINFFDNLFSITLPSGPFKPGEKLTFTTQEKARADCNVDSIAALTIRIVQPDNTYYVFKSTTGKVASWVVLKEQKVTKGQTVSQSYDFIIPTDAKEGDWAIISELFCKNTNTGIYTQLYDYASFVDFTVTRNNLVCVAGDYSDTYCVDNKWVRDRFTGRTSNNICEIQTLTLNTCSSDQQCVNQFGCVKKGGTGIIINPPTDGSNGGENIPNGLLGLNNTIWYGIGLLFIGVVLSIIFSSLMLMGIFVGAVGILVIIYGAFI